MTDRLEALEARVRLMEDRFTLQQMFAAMGPAMDGGVGTEVSDFFTEDGGYATDVPGTVPTVGSKGLAGLYEAEMHQKAITMGSGHFTGAPHIVIDGDRAEVFCHTVLFIKGEAGWMVARVAANRFWCERTADGWRIAYRLNRMLGSAEARELFLKGAFDLPWRQEKPTPKPGT